MLDGIGVRGQAVMALLSGDPRQRKPGDEAVVRWEGECLPRSENEIWTPGILLDGRD